MRYQDPTLQDKLAAEYVLGNLTGQARRRFERLLLQDPDLQACVSAWTSRLHPLNDEIEPVTPPESVWTNIMTRIEDATPIPPWQNTPFWRRIAVVAASVLLLFGTFVYFVARPVKHVVVVKNQNAQTEWVVEAQTRSRRVVVRTINPPALPKNKVCVLWLVWKDGRTRSVGVLSDRIGKTEMPLPKELVDKPEMATVVVSVETRGEAVTKPTGKIVFNGPWARL